MVDLWSYFVDHTLALPKRQAVPASIPQIS
jgi:hypothetical protein